MSDWFDLHEPGDPDDPEWAGYSASEDTGSPNGALDHFDDLLDLTELPDHPEPAGNTSELHSFDDGNTGEHGLAMMPEGLVLSEEGWLEPAIWDEFEVDGIPVAELDPDALIPSGDLEHLRHEFYEAPVEPIDEQTRGEMIARVLRGD